MQLALILLPWECRILRGGESLDGELQLARGGIPGWISPEGMDIQTQEPHGRVLQAGTPRSQHFGRALEQLSMARLSAQPKKRNSWKNKDMGQVCVAPEGSPVKGDFQSNPSLQLCWHRTALEAPQVGS